MVRAWYPARAPIECKRLPYLTSGEARGLSEALTGGLPFVFAHLKQVKANACVEALLIDGASQLPVLLFSHGFGGHVGQNTTMMEELASHGYVVLSVAHPGDAAVVEFPGGRIYPARRRMAAPATSPSESAALAKALDEESDPVRYGQAVRALLDTMPVGDAARLWADDNRFVIDRVVQGGLGKLDGRLDASRIGVFGHSLGGAAAVLTCVADRRCVAAGNVDGLQTGLPMRRDVDRPLLMLYSDHKNAARKINDEFYRATPGAPGKAPLETVILTNAGHLDGSELTIAVAPALKRLFPRHAVLGPSDGADNIRVTNAVILAFFDEHLRGTRGAFAAEVARQPRIKRWRVPTYPALAGSPQ
jgi:predicted dienelactone hydrolase